MLESRTQGMDHIGRKSQLSRQEAWMQALSLRLLRQLLPLAPGCLSTHWPERDTQSTMSMDSPLRGSLTSSPLR